MNKKESLSNIERENEFIKTLFNFTKIQEKSSSDLNNQFLSFLQNSQNGPNYFIKLIDHYSFCRPQYHDLSQLFVKSIFSCFPETIEENKTFLKSQTYLLKFIIFPEEFPINENKELKEMFLLLQKDDIDGFISFLSNNPTIDITKEQKLERGGYYFFLFSWHDSISLIDFCCFFGSLRCFKYLLLNKCTITEETLKYSIAGGN